MNLVFNELSFLEYKSNYELLGNFIHLGNLFTRAKELYGYNHILFPSNISVLKVSENKTFSEWLNEIPVKERNKVLPIIFKRPFSEDFIGEKADNLVNYYFVSNELNIEQEYCDGLAIADIMDIPSLSLKNHQIWENQKLKIWKETDTNPEEVDVYNLSNEQILTSEEFKDYTESITKIALIPSQLTYQDKIQRIHLRDDHGKDVLQRFAERILNNDYVEEVINSLPFNSHTSRFIRRVYKSGLVELVLHWEDKGLGMVIKTTGRNYRETEEIVKILKKEFDK